MKPFARFCSAHWDYIILFANHIYHLLVANISLRHDVVVEIKQQ